MFLYFRPPSIMTRIIGKITMNSTFCANKNQSYPPSGTPPSPRSVSEWRSTNSSSSLSFTSWLTLCTHLIADGQYRKTFLGRDGWKKLIGSNASLQHKSNEEGFNAFSDRSDRSKVRIGIISNDQNDCKSCNSLIGFGTGSHPKGEKSCGNEAYYVGLDNGQKSIKAMGYILVQ